MKFTVRFAKGVETTTEYPEGSTYKIAESGALRVSGPDGMTTYYAPSAWQSVTHKTRKVGGSDSR